ncbi:MAG: hypothetical protein P8Z36_11445 [Gemmatimonadota bacterium]|jgi:hypothetical protein
MIWLRRSLFILGSAFALTLGNACGGAAQTKPAAWSAAWLEMGPTMRGQSDLMASPLAYQGAGLHVAGGYQRRRGGHRLSVGGSYESARLTSRITAGSDHTERVFVASLGVRSLYSAGSAWSGRVRFYAGGQVDLRVPVRSHDYVGGMKEYFADVFLPVQAAGAWEASLGPVVVAERLAVPLFAVVGRCPYTGLKYMPVFSVAPPGRLVGFDHAISVGRAASDRVDVRLEWRTTLLRYPEPRELSMVTHRLGLAVALHGSRVR